MIDFLKESKSFAGVTFSGLFDIDLDVLSAIYQHYKETGENLLDDYCACIHKSWEEVETQSILREKEFKEYMTRLSKLESIKVIDRDFSYKVTSIVNTQYENYQRYTAYPNKRVQASSYTSKQNVRKKVFKLHGKQCLVCGCDEDIQLDHIKPVRKGGEDIIDNLQPLCKTCNIQKGTKTIDYRG